MKLQRRGFLKTATTGLTLGFANRAIVFGQTSTAGVSGEIETRSETLRLRGKLKSGILSLDAQEFQHRADRSVIVRSKLESTELYSAMFSYHKDLTVFALFNDNDHSTAVALSESSERKIGHAVVWNDNNTPQIYKVNKGEIMEAESPKDVRDVNSKPLDLLGSRKPPAFTWQELESAFGSDPALLEFMRGRKSTHHPAEKEKLSEWICRLLSIVPGSLLSLFWLA